MLKNKFDYLTYIGRFQLPHEPHFKTMEQALSLADKLIICVGSSNCRRSLRNPFSFDQRVMLIEYGATEAVRKAINMGRVIFIPIEDSHYNDPWWIEHVQRQVKRVTDKGSIRNPKIGIIGCNKDETTYYLNMFPQWELVPTEQTKIFAATDCRNAYYEYGIEDKRTVNRLYDFTTSGVINALRYIPTQVYEDLNQRYKFCNNYKQKWGSGPFYTADSVVIKSGHVLLVTRREQPDAGALAFPGGFINKDEGSETAAIRECKEETGLVLPDHSVKTVGDYAMPFRDDRADIRTTAYMFDLGYGPLPEVKGSDDAEHAAWYPFVDLTPANMFSDHYFILKDLQRKL